MDKALFGSDTVVAKRDLKSDRTRVLLIEDNHNDARLFQEMLAEASEIFFELVFADHLSTGLEHLKKRQVDVILLDLGLPDSQGLKTFEKIHDFQPEVPTIILSSLDDLSVAMNSVQAGAQDYLVKGEISGRMLIRAIHNAIERHQMMRVLQANETRLRTIIEQIADGIIVVGDDGTVLYANPAAVHLFGRTQEKIVGADFGIPTTSEKPPLVDIIWPCGTTVIVEMNQATTLWEGKLVKLISLSNVTERAQAERALRDHSNQLEDLVQARTQELQAAQNRLIRQEKLAALGQLAGGVSHELRNPLGAIKNAAYYLYMVLAEMDIQPETREMLEILRKEIDNAERIITSLLDYARTKPPNKHKIDVNLAIQEVLINFLGKDNQDFEIQMDLDDTLPPIQADPDQLHQILENIIRNGIQAILERLQSQDGRLIISTTQQKVGCVTILVTDNGVGIPEKNLCKIFEPLFTTKAKGIGLGMAVVKALVDSHGGFIDVESEVGIGTTITINLPVNKEN